MRKLVSMICILSLLLSGCGISDAITTSEGYNLTEEEIIVLVSAGSSENRIRRGNLTSSDKRNLKGFRYAKEYLVKKYDEIEDINWYDTANYSLNDTVSTLYYGVIKGDDPDEFVQTDDDFFQVRVYFDNNNVDYAEDTYYAIYHEDDFNEYWKDLFKSYGYTVTETTSYIRGYLGEEYDKNCSPEELYEEDGVSGLYGIHIRYGNINAEECESMIEDIESKLKEDKHIGNYRLYFSNDLDEYMNEINIFSSDL